MANAHNAMFYPEYIIMQTILVTHNATQQACARSNQTPFNLPSLKRSFEANPLKKQIKKIMTTDGRRLYVGGLPYKTDERDLRELCDKFGHVEDGKDFAFLCSQPLVASGQICGPKFL